MIRKTIIAVLTLAAVGTGLLWVASLRRPIQFCSGPTFRDVRWSIVRNRLFTGWGGDSLDEKLVYSNPRGQYPWSALEVPFSEVPPFLPILPDDWLLLGVGFGALHIGKAYFGPVPNPETPPAKGCTYVTSQHVAIAIPLWPIMALTGVIPLIDLIRGPLRRHRRRKRGLCETCGYDLRGSPGRCPECGRQIDSP